jgi:NitT/TauT family transport system ATP-binding protein
MATSATAAAGAARPAPAKGGAVTLRDLDVRFGSFLAVEGASLDVAAGELVCLLGPSGCGKSTLLNVVAGFERPARGEALVGGEPVGRPDVSRGMVFQGTDALFPWLTVRDNIAFGPRMRRVDGAARKAAVDAHLELVGLAHAADKYPPELSGGMQQRVQIARVLVNQPAVVLMDEPFGALDAQTREAMQRELERIWRETRPTVIFVTHDITEAILLADRVVTMTSGPAARIKAVYDVPLPRPRDETDPAAITLHRTLRADIGEEAAKALRSQEGIADGGR